MARKTESELRAAIAELEGRAVVGGRTAQGREGAAARPNSTAPRDERDRLSRELAAIKRETEETWASERVENALLRERINDVAAEVARLASALEGPNSPIEAILAAETRATDLAAPAAGARRARRRSRAEQRQSRRPHPRAARRTPRACRNPTSRRAGTERRRRTRMRGSLDTASRRTPYIARP